MAIDAEPKGTNGEGEPKAARVLLGVCRSAAVAGVLLVLLLTFRGVSACFSGEIDLASGLRRQVHSLNPANFPMQLLRWDGTHPLLSAPVAFACLSQSPLRADELARCLPFPSSPTIPALI